jgi:glycosyltransferase EpsD
LKRILFVANVHQHFLDCHVPYIKWLKEQGHEVHVAAGEDQLVPEASKQFNISIQRSPFRFGNISAYYELKKIIRENKYDLIHCHTPMGAVVARLAARNFRWKGLLKVLYTAHGFHFFKGAPLVYWLTFYLAEKWLSRYTDAIITINQEDYDLVKTHGFRNKETFRIDSIGVTAGKFFKISREEKSALRGKYGYSDDQFLLIYAAEFIHRKNHRFIIDALPILVKEIPELKILFAGTGELMFKMKAYCHNKNLDPYIDFLEFWQDIGPLMAISDVGISSSRQEGYGMHIAEGMFCGIPFVVTEDRGHREMIIDGVNGYMFPQNDRQKFIERIIHLNRNPEIRKKLGEAAFDSIQKCAVENSLKSMMEIYNRYLALPLVCNEG